MPNNHKILIALVLAIGMIIISGCTNNSGTIDKIDTKQNNNSIPNGKFCEVDDDCQCFSGNFCGCYNKDFKTPEPRPRYLCDADCMGYPCVCINNTCQDSR